MTAAETKVIDLMAVLVESLKAAPVLDAAALERRRITPATIIDGPQVGRRLMVDVKVPLALELDGRSYRLVGWWADAARYRRVS